MKNFLVKTFIVVSPFFGQPEDTNMTNMTNITNSSTFLPEPHPSLKDKIECDFCKDVVGIVEHRLNTSNTTINVIEEIINRICSLMLSKPKREVCQTIIKDIDKVKDMIIGGLDPKDICYKMELCK
tara:strand:- start:300 stop:677 length:378 start_codon:yes stop_codon:yes gene_type:complete